MKADQISFHEPFEMQKKKSNNGGNNDEIPDFLIDSVPYLNNAKQLSQINKDSINPYLPAEKARKLSSSSIRSVESEKNTSAPSSKADKSTYSEGDASKFSFEAASGGPSPIAPNGHRIVSTTSEPAYNNSSPNVSNYSFHTAQSGSFMSPNNSRFMDVTPSQIPLPISSSSSTSPKIPLTIQTSTPNEKTAELYDTTGDSSNNQFSFFNTSPAYHPDSPSANIKNTTAKRVSVAPRDSPHSRNSSISWAVNNPDEWTIERVVYWLELNQFNESWTTVFKKHGLYGQKFLSLTNYQNLKNFKLELATSNDSTQSRFIHLLRKTLDKPTSATTISAFSPLPTVSPNSSFDSLESNPANSEDLNFRSRQRSGIDPLVPTISAPTFHHNEEKSSPVLPPSTNQQPPSVPQQRLPKVHPKRRPVSTIESSSKNMWSNSPVSPAVPHGFFRRHQKSSSSESSLFTSIFPSSSSNNTQQTDDKRSNGASRSDNNESKGLLSKFRKRTDRSKSREPAQRDTSSPVSPVSLNALDNNKRAGKKLDFKFEERNKSVKTLSDDLVKPFIIERKYLPVPQQNNSDKYILVTKDNQSFVPVNVGSCVDLDSFKSTLIKSIFPNSNDATIHLTDFGCSIGEALNDATLESLRSSSFSNCSAKVLITSTDTISSIASSSVASLSDTQSFETKGDDKLYPNTPQHFYDNAVSRSQDVDYLNFKTYSAPPASIASTPSISSTAPQTAPPKPISPPIVISSPPPARNNTEIRRSSFRVIRPQERPEINFDKRRESPFARASNFVAKRSAPPPPLGRQVSRLNSDKPLLTPVKESVSNEGTYIASYTPGSSNTLIPEPYKGSSGSVSPVSRKGFDLNDRSSSSTSVTESRNNAIKRSLTRKVSINSKNAADKFQENVISFDDAPALDDETSDDDSDDDFWAKAPSDLKENEEKSAQEISKMVVRPAPEVLYDNLEKFFPNANLDQPVVDITPPASPMNDKQVKKDPSRIQKTVISSTSDEEGFGKLSKPHRVKTIRAVAREASEARKRESIRRTINQNTNLVRRQSTKMWGKKVVEVKPNQTQYLSKLRSQKGEIKQFSWIRGELIGKGTFGNVYLALNVTTGEMIAVKQVLAPERVSENAKVPEVIEALRSEVETLKDLDHLNIVQYLGFEKTEKEYNLFLEYVAGGSVASCLRLYGKFEEPLIRFLTLQVLKGLSYLHTKGILHRDMKADNILLDLDGVCKISDFGISKKSNDIYANDAAMSMQGTIFWMAPEVVDSREGYSAKVDIWSLGCVVLEMFAGRRPWSNLEAITAMFKIGKAKAAPPIPEDILPSVSMEGRNFLDSCFAIDASKRPTAQELCNDRFCEVEPNFSFSSTRLAQLIKTNEKKITV